MYIKYIFINLKVIFYILLIKKLIYIIRKHFHYSTYFIYFFLRFDALFNKKKKKVNKRFSMNEKNIKGVSLSIKRIKTKQ